MCVYDLGDSVKTHIQVQTQTFVKVARNMIITDPFHASDSDARAWIMDNMHRGEKYFMSLPPCAEVSQDWDGALIDMLPSPKAIITAQCQAFTPQVHFLALGTIAGSRVIVVNKPCITRPTSPVPSLFWVPSLSFSLSAAMIASPPISDGIVRNTFSDATLNGICLWTHGYDFFTPHESIAWKTGNHTEIAWHPAPRDRPAAAQAMIGTIRTTRQYEAFSGIDLKLKVSTRRAHTGLTPTYDVTEALVKSGSVQSARIAVSPAGGKQVKAAQNGGSPPTGKQRGRQQPPAKSTTNTTAHKRRHDRNGAG